MNIGITGKNGEDRVAAFLRKQGLTIAKRNYQCRFGEIDIIAESQEYIIFVEVKTRNENSIAAPREAVTLLKQDKIKKTAARYLLGVKLQPRFDIIEVILDENKKLVNIEHIENAFE